MYNIDSSVLPRNSGYCLKCDGRRVSSKKEAHSTLDFSYEAFLDGIWIELEIERTGTGQKYIWIGRIQV